MDEKQAQETAAQLRKPYGENGIKTGEWMSHGNQHIIRAALELVSAKAGDNILEVGMGNGFFVKEIVSKHPKIFYTGCDYSALMIEESQKENAEWILNGQATFVLSEFLALPFAGHSFNKIVTINTIYFWDEEVKVLNEIKRVLQPNGKFIIGFRPKHQTEKYPFTKYGFNLFSKDSIVKLLSENGFEVNEVQENREPDFEMNGAVVNMENIIVVVTKV